MSVKECFIWKAHLRDIFKMSVLPINILKTFSKSI